MEKKVATCEAAVAPVSDLLPEAEVQAPVQTIRTSVGGGADGIGGTDSSAECGCVGGSKVKQDKGGMPGSPAYPPIYAARQRRSGFWGVLRFWSFVTKGLPEVRFA